MVNQPRDTARYSLSTSSPAPYAPPFRLGGLSDLGQDATPAPFYAPEETECDDNGDNGKGVGDVDGVDLISGEMSFQTCMLAIVIMGI